MLNRAQRIVADTYEGGEFAHVQSIDDARDVGDGLFLFLMVELSDDEDCLDQDEAIRRVAVATEQLLDVSMALHSADYNQG